MRESDTALAVIPPLVELPSRSEKPPTDVKIIKNLIAAVERRPQLWMRSHTINVETRRSIWQLWNEVSKEVVLSIQICQFKWKSLRATFVKLYKNNKKAWRFYDDMRFLEGQILRKPTVNDWNEDATTGENNASSAIDNSNIDVVASVNLRKALITAIKNRPELWVPKRKTSGEVRCKANVLWNEISQEMALPIYICQYKWRTLRNTFMHMYKYNQTTWSFYEHMSFLVQVAKNVQPNVLNNDPAENITSEDDIKILIAAVKSKPKLWMKNQIKIDEEECRSVFSLWNEISQEMKLSIQICRNNWRSLRNNFLKRWKYNEITWRFYNDLSFLKKAFNSERKQKHRVSEPKGGVSSPENLKLKMVSTGKNEEIQKKTVEITQSTSKDTISLMESETGTMSDLSFKYTTGKRTTFGNYYYNAQQNEDRVFLLSFVPYMQRLGERRRLRLRQKLQNAVVEEFN